MNDSIILHLRLLGAGLVEPYKSNAGICYEIWHKFHVKFVNIIDCVDWRYYSGDIDFPIPSVDETQTAENIYYLSENKWDNDQHGDMRRELCIYCADYLEGVYNI